MFRLITLGVLALNSLAFAAPVPANLPVPKSNSSVQLHTIKGEGPLVDLNMQVLVPVTKTGTRTVEIMGKNVMEQYTYTVYETVVQSYKIDLSTFQCFTQNGKELPLEAYLKRMKTGVPTVFENPGSPLDPEWWKLFADDVVFLKPLPPK